MVLENASDSMPDSFTEDVSRPDIDTNSRSPPRPRAPPIKITIDTTHLPRPIPLIGRMNGYSHKLLTDMIQMRLTASHKMLNRPVTEEEANAIAYWTAKQLSVTSYGAPLGVAAGAWRSINTKKTFRFPFFQPDIETFNTKVWPSANRAILTGPLATSAWHSTRFFAYAAVGQFIGQLIFSSYSVSIVTVGELSDPRLKNYVKGMREAAQKKFNRSPRGNPQGTAPSDEPETVNDSSPADISFDTFDDGITDTGILDDQKKASQETQQESLSNATKSTASPVGRQRTAPASRSVDEGIDDASPTGGRGVAMDNESTGESAWDRIRHQSTVENSRSSDGGSSWPSGLEAPQGTGRGAWARIRPGTQVEESTEPTSDDPFTFSDTDADRQLARAEAQKEFDARVERERKGGDFSSGGGDQRRW